MLNNKYTDFLSKIEEEDLILNETPKTNKNISYFKDNNQEDILIFDGEYLEMCIEFLVFYSEDALNQEILERIRFSSVYTNAIIGYCEHSSFGNGLVLEKVKTESVFAMVYNKELNFVEKINLIFNLIAFFDFSNSRGKYFYDLNLSNFLYDKVSNKLYMCKYPLIDNEHLINEDFAEDYEKEWLVNISPEYFFGQSVSDKSDAWNLGLLIYEILEENHLIFPNSQNTKNSKIIETFKTYGNYNKDLEQNNSGIYTFLNKKINSLDYNQYIKNTLKKLLKINPCQRTSTKLIKQTFNKKMIIESHKLINDTNSKLLVKTTTIEINNINDSACPIISNQSFLDITKDDRRCISMKDSFTEHLKVEETIIDGPSHKTFIKNNTSAIERQGDSIEKIFERNQEKQEVNLIDEKNLSKDMVGIINPVLGEINEEGENFIQFEENTKKDEEKDDKIILYTEECVLKLSNITGLDLNNLDLSDININGNKNLMNLESNLNNSKNNILFPTVKSTMSKTNRLEELAHDWFLTGHEKALEEIMELVNSNPEIKESIHNYEEKISENLWEALLSIAYKCLENDEIKTHQVVATIIYNTVEKVYPENLIKLAIAKFHYAKSIKDYSCNFSLSLNLYLESLSIFEKINESKSKLCIQVKFFLGNLLDDMGRHEESIDMLKDVLASQIEIYTENHCFTARTFNCLGIAEDNRGNYKLAKEYYNKAYVIFKCISFGLETIDCAKVLNNLAGIYFKWEDWITSIKLYLKVLEIYSGRYGDCSSYIAMTQYNIGNCYLMLDNFDKAKEFFITALNIFKKELGHCHAQTAMCMKTLGDVYYALEDDRNALDLYKQCVNIFLEKYGDDNDMYISTISKIQKLSISSLPINNSQDIL